MQRRRYLVVDDNAAFAENVGEILRAEGADPTVVTSCAEALKLLEREPSFDALVTDMRMPGLGGAELLREARRVDPALPAIVVTAWSDERDLRALEELDLLAVLTKPVPIPQLLALLASADRNARGRKRPGPA